MLDSLNEYRKNVTSQAGEDGIIEYLCARLGIQSGWCVEFGAWDGKHLSNTWNLIQNGWSGVLIEGNKEKAESLNALYVKNPSVYTICAYVGFDESDQNGLDALLSATPTPKKFELLSIDIDGNDWYVWNAMKNYQPAVVIIEANSSIPASVSKVHPVNSGGGASARALVELARCKGYELVAHTGNCIFVRSDLYPKVDLQDNSLDILFDTRFLCDEKKNLRTKLLTVGKNSLSKIINIIPSS
ncbi:MAG: hypothetical protein V8K32_00280 [Candidatus Electrothrix gigas]